MRPAPRTSRTNIAIGCLIILLIFGIVNNLTQVYDTIGVVRLRMRNGKISQPSKVVVREAVSVAQSNIVTTAARTLKEAVDTDPIGGKLPAKLHENWQNQVPNANAELRKIACSIDDATKYNSLGVAKVQCVVQMDLDCLDEFASLEESLPHFEAAIATDPTCMSAVMNKGLALFGLHKYEEAELLFAQVGASNHQLKGRGLLYENLCLDATLRKSEGDLFEKFVEAASIDNRIAMEYFALTWEAMKLRNQGMFPIYPLMRYTGKPMSQHIVTKAMSRLLLLKEFGAWFGGYPAMTKAEADSWHKGWFIFIRNMLPPMAVTAAQGFYREMIAQGHLEREDAREGYQAVRFLSYNDPVARILHAEYNQMIMRITERKTKPSYTYFGGYLNQSVLHPHRDRQQCEYTLSVNLDINPIHEQCPLEFGSKAKNIPPTDNGGGEPFPPEEQRMVAFHRPGDGVLINGRRIIHWRAKMKPNFNCSQVFLHYVHYEFTKTLR